MNFNFDPKKIDKNIVSLVAAIIIGLTFLISGTGKIFGLRGTVKQLRHRKGLLVQGEGDGYHAASMRGRCDSRRRKETVPIFPNGRLPGRHSMGFIFVYERMD